MRLVLLSLIAGLPLLGLANSSNTPLLPIAIQSLAPNLQLQGKGELKWFGLSVYDAYFWSRSKEWRQDEPYILDIHYHRSISNVQFAERSAEEIEKLGLGTPEQRSEWTKLMKNALPSVQKGDHIIGVNLPNKGAQFFHNGKLYGEIADPDFAQAFFAIWLHPKTSRPELRKKLLSH